MASPELLPCPFCGGGARIISGPPGCHYARCDGCGVCTDDGGIERAVAAWNRRSGVAAELRTLAAMADDEVASAKLERIGLPANSASNACLTGLSIGSENTAKLIAARIRARIAALEEEA